MRSVSSAIIFHTTDKQNRPASFSLKDAIDTIEWQAERLLDNAEVEAVTVYLSICPKHQQDMVPRIEAWKWLG